MDTILAWLTSVSLSELLSVSASSYALIFAAEIGDKSQLVCMTLATRYRALPVILGAISAFVVLNTLAVIFGVAIAAWFPEGVLLIMVGTLFAVFGIHALRVEESEEEEVAIISSHKILMATFFMITLAEFGDKTQLAVVALSSTGLPIGVWLGSTAALITTSVLGVWAGRTLLQRFPIHLLHRISGVIFIVLAIHAFYRAFSFFYLDKF